ncbi:MAG: NYN domain-containing protein [Caulobacteraceae bacterium]
MTCVAIFVDAGYLFAQGSVALTGAKRTRSELRLNDAAVIAALTSVAHEKSEGARLLRIYWYDAPLQSGMSAQQSGLAFTDHVKLRLGVLNGRGEQKGVDSLIVTDLIELARNRAISDAVLVSGDEDVRIGVQIAQNYGVSVHLVGLHPAPRLAIGRAPSGSRYDDGMGCGYGGDVPVRQRRKPPARRDPRAPDADYPRS